MKLKLKHLAPYLPYRLKVSRIHILHHGSGIGSISHILTTESEYYKPRLRPLSDFVDINGKAMNELNLDVSTQIDINELAIGYKNLSQMHYTTVESCFEFHIDIFNLIPAGLAVKL